MRAQKNADYCWPRALLAKADDPWGLEHKDAYDVLKVPFDASREQIKQAYKARSKELHPDKLRKSDNEPSGQLRKAYDIVGFPRSKKKYDKEARKRHKHAPRRAENTLAADLAGDRKPINVVVGTVGERPRAVVGRGPGVAGRLARGAVRSGRQPAGEGGRFSLHSLADLRQADAREARFWLAPVAARRQPGAQFGGQGPRRERDLVFELGGPRGGQELPGARRRGGLRVHRRTADNVYAPCAWGSMGCGGGLAPVRNSIRVLLRSMFYPSALNRKKGVLSSLVGAALRRAVDSGTPPPSLSVAPSPAPLVRVVASIPPMMPTPGRPPCLLRLCHCYKIITGTADGAYFHLKKPAGGARSESSSPAPRNIVRHQACAASWAVPFSKFWNLASCITKMGAWMRGP